MFVFFVCFFLLHYTFLQLEKQNNKVVHTIYYFLILRGSIGKPGDSMAQMMKNLPAMRGTRVRCLGQEDPLEKGMAIHSSILAWRIPKTEEPGGLQSKGSKRVRHN